MRVLAALALLALAGCARDYVWVGGDSERQFKVDNYECRRDSRTFGGGSGIPGALALMGARRQAKLLYEECMEARGYTRSE